MRSVRKRDVRKASRSARAEPCGSRRRSCVAAMSRCIRDSTSARACLGKILASFWQTLPELKVQSSNHEPDQSGAATGHLSFRSKLLEQRLGPRVILEPERGSAAVKASWNLSEACFRLDRIGTDR